MTKEVTSLDEELGQMGLLKTLSDDMVSNVVEDSGLRKDACIPFTQKGFMYPLRVS